MEKLEKLLNQYEANGSDVEKLKEVRAKVQTMLENNNTMITCFKEIVSEIEEKSKKFLHSKSKGDISNIFALSSCIYLPSENGTYKIKVLGGKDNNGEEITKETVFDVASITKLFTLIFTFKLDEIGVLSKYDKVTDYLPEYKGLEDFTINDLLLLCGQLYTNGNIAEADTKEGAEAKLKTIYLKSKNRSENKYTDFGAIIISKIIEKVVSEESGKLISFDEIMDKHFFEPFGMKNTSFNPKAKSIAGNGFENGVHDRKARILGPVGSAGVFTISDDLAALARKIYHIRYFDYMALRDIISKQNLDNLGTVTFPNSEIADKGYLGTYQKSSDPSKIFVPSLYADKSFAAQGWTGSLAIFDPKNRIHNNILVSAITKDARNLELYRHEKALGYKEAIGDYENAVATYSITLEILRECYNEYLNLDVERYVR